MNSFKTLMFLIKVNSQSCPDANYMYKHALGDCYSKILKENWKLNYQVNKVFGITFLELRNRPSDRNSLRIK
jgi:hypothetical protein